MKPGRKSIYRKARYRDYRGSPPQQLDPDSTKLPFSRRSALAARLHSHNPKWSLEWLLGLTKQQLFGMAAKHL